MTPLAKTRLVKEIAAAVGFDRTGVSSAGPVAQGAYYREWLAAGHAGAMGYLHRNTEAREHPAQLLPGARSIICVALSYHRPNAGGRAEPQAEHMADVSARLPGVERGGDAGPTAPGSSAPSSVRVAEPDRPAGRVAMYARGRDYHVVMREMLAELVRRVRESLQEPFDARPFVDTGPLLERQLAQRAGLGWVGKNTLVLNQQLGSYVFLGEVLTTLELVSDAPATDHCGTCTRCLDACPTGAFPAPYQMDASRCISYLTIEHRSDMPKDLAEQVGDWVYGCDICQQVCPFNRDAPAGTNTAIMSDLLPARLDLLDLVELRSGQYRRLVAGTAARRASRPMWRRNARVALRNVSAGSASR